MFQGAALHEIVCVRGMKQILEFACIATGARGRIPPSDVKGLGRLGGRSERPYALKALHEGALAAEATGTDS
jgi:hypothetical protein